MIYLNLTLTLSNFHHFYIDAQLCPEDEFYEREVISTNKVYKLQEGEPPHLIPVTELCGYMPRIGILNTKEVESTSELDRLEVTKYYENMHQMLFTFLRVHAIW